MAASQPLHIFPPVDQVERRREELDNLIKKSLDMRPTRPFTRERLAPVARRATSKSRTRTPLHQAEVRHERENESASLHYPVVVPKAASVSQSEPPKPQQQPQRQSTQETVLPSHPVHETVQPMTTQLDYVIPKSTSGHWHQGRESAQPTGFNPDVMKTDPLPLPPLDTTGIKRSFSRTPARMHRPRRSSSAKGHGRMSNASTRTSTTFSPASSHGSSTFSTILSTIDSPVTNPSIYGSIVGSRPHSKFEDPTHSFVKQQQLQQQQRRQQQRQAYPLPSVVRQSETEGTYNIPPPPPPPRSDSRQSNYTSVTSTPPRELPSRVSHLQQDSISEHTQPHRQRSHDSITLHESPMLSRSNTIEVNSPESYYMPEKPMQTNTVEQSISSMFPTYDPAVPLQHQSYHPQRAAPLPPLAKIKHDHHFSSSSEKSESTSSSSDSRHDNEISTMKQLGDLWAAANGQITAPVSGPYNLKMFKQSEKAKRRSKITFGPAEDEVFYSLAQSHPSIDEDNEPHEALIFRHNAAEKAAPNPAQDDLLPISHMLVYPPPAPTVSKYSRHASSGHNDSEAATQITSITPVLATLHALDHASKTHQAHTLALVDPKAESPAAARLAERAVKAAQERESCTLSWMRTGPAAGKYELHHPSLGVFTVQVEGDVKSALSSISSSTKSRKHASISLMNPFASLPSKSPDLNALSPTSFAFGIARGSGIGRPASNAPSSVLAKLDFTTEVLHLDAPAVQSLGNLYLLDVCISTILSVAIAESQRPDDPGLLFAAPPPSLMLAKVKKGSRIFSSSGNGAVAEPVSRERSKRPTNASTVSLVAMVRGTGKKGGERKAIDWTRANAIMGIEHLTDVDDLPRITRGVLSVLGLSFKTALWLLEFGVKISAKMVIGLSKFAEKA